MSTVVRARRDQRGFTLVELLAALAIIATVMVPITAWGLLSMRQQSELQDRTSTSSASGLLRTYLTGDVASSTSVAVNGAGSPCPGDTDATTITVNDDSGPSATYVMGVMEDLDGDPVEGRLSLWRIDCTGAVHDLQIVEDITSATPTCDPGCGVVSLSVFRREDMSHPIELTVGRRTGL